MNEYMYSEYIRELETLSKYNVKIPAEDVKKRLIAIVETQEITDQRKFEGDKD